MTTTTEYQTELLAAAARVMTGQADTADEANEIADTMPDAWHLAPAAAKAAGLTKAADTAATLDDNEHTPQEASNVLNHIIGTFAAHHQIEALIAKATERMRADRT